jgi:hypothetical protein
LGNRYCSCQSRSLTRRVTGGSYWEQDVDKHV